MTRKDPGFGLVILDSRIASAALVARGAGVQESAFTEAEPLPGHPENDDERSAWRPQAVGAQSAHLTTRTIVGGFPRRGDGASIAYRLEADTDDEDWRGWSEPNLPVNWTAPASAWLTTSAFTNFAAAVVPSTGLVVVVASQASAETAQAYTYQPRTGTWADTFDFDNGSEPGLIEPISLAWDPEGERLILWSGSGTSQVALQSDDDGTTWSTYARHSFRNLAGSTPTFGVDTLIRVAPRRGVDWLAIVIDDDDGTGVGLQYASSDHGVTFEQVDQGGGSGTMNGEGHYVVPTGSGFVVAFRAASTSYPSVKVLGSARSPFNGSATITLEAVAATNIWAVTDDDGVVYVYALDATGLAVHRSLDDGATWEAYSFEVLTVDVAIPRWHTAVASCGQVHLIGEQSGGDADVSGTFHLVSFGGWGNVEHGSGEEFGLRRSGRASYGAFVPATPAGVSDSGLVYFPWGFPEDQGWTAAHSGTRDLTSTTAPGLELANAGPVTESYNGLTGTGSTVFGEAVVIADAAAATLATIGALYGPHVAGKVSDGAASYWIWIDIGRDGLRLRDKTDDSVKGTATIAVTTKTWIRWVVSAGKGSAWYRQSLTAEWTPIVVDATLAAGADATCVSSFGHSNGVASEVVFAFAAARVDADWRYSIDTTADAALTPASGVRGLGWGKAVPGVGGRYPLPELTTTSEDLGFVRSTGGPTYDGELVELPESYRYPVEALHPTESPSPRVQWRATGVTATRLVYDYGEPEWAGGSIALLALNVDARTVTIALDDGAGGFTTHGTLDKGWSSINFTRVGRALAPRSGTATIDRYFHEDELVGGYVVISTSGSPVARRIVRNSSGHWTTSATQKQVRITLEELDGTEDTSATGEIVHHSGILVVHLTTDFVRQFVRIGIAASQVVPDTRYAAGIFSLGRVMAAGTDPGWDWSRNTELSREVERRADGSPSIRRTGPPRRVLRYGWPDGLDLLDLRSLARAPDYVATSAGLPLGAESDVATSFVGAIVNQLRSGEVPAVVLPKIPATGVTITDPTLYLYGLATADSWDVTGLVGEEGTNEIVRAAGGLTFEELV